MNKISEQAPVPERTDGHPDQLSDTDVARIRAHLQELLSSPLFSSSKRIPALLAHVVQQSLESVSGEHIKERTLGIEVFGRPVAYDTNNDPVVRITAGELRKKLAQYYYTHPGSEIEIGIPVGSYMPKFHFRGPLEAESSEAALQYDGAPQSEGRLAAEATHSEDSVAKTNQADFPAAVELAAPVMSPAVNEKRRLLWAVSIFCICVFLGFLTWKMTHLTSSVDRFWSSFAEPSHNVLIVAGSVSPTPQALSQYHFEAESLALQDADVVSKLRSEFSLKHVSSSLLLGTGASLTDLRAQPFILIGAFNNPWTQRITQNLPFSFERSADRRYGSILERADPKRVWTEDFGLPNATLQKDYGIVARFNDSSTGQAAVVIAGISAEGTLAASEVLTTPQYFEMLDKALGKSGTNFEAVIQTEVVNGHSGPPQIVATKVW